MQIITSEVNCPIGNHPDRKIPSGQCWPDIEYIGPILDSNVAIPH